MKRKEEKEIDTNNITNENLFVSDNDLNIENSEANISEKSATETAEEVLSVEATYEANIAELKANLAVANDKYLRLSAEFDNFRKRTLKEKMDLMKTASETVLTNILSVFDDFDRAMIAIDNATDTVAIKEGMQLIDNKFKDFAKQNGLSEIEATGKELDTDLHEAIVTIPAPTSELKGKIVDVIQKGYSLNDKVIRFAKVVVGE